MITTRAFFKRESLGLVFLGTALLVAPNQSLAACESENPEDLEQSIRSVKCQASEVRAKRDRVKMQIKEILLKRIEEYRSSPEFISSLRSIDSSRARLAVQERYAAPLAAVKMTYLSAVTKYEATIKGFASDTALVVDTSSVNALRRAQMRISDLVGQRHIEFTRAQFEVRRATFEAENLCQNFRRDGGFGCSFSEPDYSSAERHLTNLNAWQDVTERALAGALEADIEARKSAVRKETMEFEAVAAFFGHASALMRAYMEGPMTVGPSHVYVDFLRRADALLSVPCEAPARYQASGCKTIALQVDSARAFRTALPRYIREDLPRELYERVKSLPLEEQVAQHEAYFRGAR